MKIRFKPFWRTVGQSGNDFGNAFVSSWGGAMMAFPGMVVLFHYSDQAIAYVVIASVAYALWCIGVVLLGLYVTGDGIEIHKQEHPK
jgi:hypothetical protein